MPTHQEIGKIVKDFVEKKSAYLENKPAPDPVLPTRKFTLRDLSPPNVTSFIAKKFNWSNGIDKEAFKPTISFSSSPSESTVTEFDGKGNSKTIPLGQEGFICSATIEVPDLGEETGRELCPADDWYSVSFIADPDDEKKIWMEFAGTHFLHNGYLFKPVTPNNFVGRVELKNNPEAVLEGWFSHIEFNVPHNIFTPEIGKIEIGKKEAQKPPKNSEFGKIEIPKNHILN